MAVYTLTYVYRDSTAVLGPLAAYVEPHCYDLCARHADRLTVPRGWDVVRLPASSEETEAEAADDLEALANAVREATTPRRPAEPVGQGVEIGRRGHLRVLRSAPSIRRPPPRPLDIGKQPAARPAGPEGRPVGSVPIHRGPGRGSGGERGGPGGRVREDLQGL